MGVFDVRMGQGAFSIPSKRSTCHQISKPPRVQMVARATCGIKMVHNSLSRQSSPSCCSINQITGIVSHTSKEGHFLVDEGFCVGKRYLVTAPVQAFGQSATLIHCQDLYREKLEVVIKVMHASYYAVGLKEILTLRRLNSANSCTRSHTICLLNAFTFDDHVCLVFPAYNPRPLNQILRGRELSPNQKISQIRKIALHLMSALAFLNQHRTIHADLRPENILMNKDEEIDSIVVADFGNAILHVHKEVALYYSDFELQTLSYRAPEIFIGMPFSVEIDMWSLGCILTELYLSRPLFTGKDRSAVLRQMTALLGPFPPNMLLQGKFSEDVDLSQETDFLCKSNSTVTRLMSKLPTLKDFQFASFLSGLLEFDPNKRLTPPQAIQHPFMAKEFCINFFLPDWSPYSGVISQEDYKFKQDISPNMKRLCPSTYDILKAGTTDANLKVLVKDMAHCENGGFRMNSQKKHDELLGESRCSKSLYAYGPDSEREANNNQKLLPSYELINQNHTSKLLSGTELQDEDCESKLCFPKVDLSKLSSVNEFTTETYKQGMMCPVQLLDEDQKSEVSSYEPLVENYKSAFHCYRNVVINHENNAQSKSKELNASQIQQENNEKDGDIVMKENDISTNGLSALVSIPGVECPLNMGTPASERSFCLNATVDSIDLPALAVEIDHLKEDEYGHEKSKNCSSLPSEQSKTTGNKEPNVDLSGDFLSVTGGKIKQKDCTGTGAQHRLTEIELEVCTTKVGYVASSENASLMESQDRPKQEGTAAHMNVDVADNVDTGFQFMSSNGLKSHIHKQKPSSDHNMGLWSKKKKRKCSLDVTYGEKIRYMYTNLHAAQPMREKGSTLCNRRNRKDKGSKGSALYKGRQGEKKRSICLKGQTNWRKQEQISDIPQSPGISTIVKSTHERKGNDILNLKNSILQDLEPKMSVKKYRNRLKGKGGERENIPQNRRQSNEINFALKKPLHNSNRSSHTEALDSQLSTQNSSEHKGVHTKDEMSSKHDNVSESGCGRENPSLQKKGPSSEQISKNSSASQSNGNTMCGSGASMIVPRKIKARRSLWRSSVEENKRLENIISLGRSRKEVLDSEVNSGVTQKDHPQSRKRLLQISPMAKDKSMLDPYEFKVTPAKETTILCERYKKRERKNLPKKQRRKPPARSKLCKSNEESVCLLDLVQKKTEQFFVRNENDCDKKIREPSNSISSPCESQTSSEAMSVLSKTASVDCFSNEKEAKDCKLAKGLPSYKPIKESMAFPIEIGDKRETTSFNDVGTNPCKETLQNSKKEINAINSCEVTAPQMISINFHATSSVTHFEQQPTCADQLLDDKGEDDDIFLL